VVVRDASECIQRHYRKGYSLAIISRRVVICLLIPAIFSGQEPPV
jgi:hypothetical protein